LRHAQRNILRVELIWRKNKPKLSDKFLLVGFHPRRLADDENPAASRRAGDEIPRQIVVNNKRPGMGFIRREYVSGPDTKPSGRLPKPRRQSMGACKSDNVVE
jgi:hypothetical protein